MKNMPICGIHMPGISLRQWRFHPWRFQYRSFQGRAPGGGTMPVTMVSRSAVIDRGEPGRVGAGRGCLELALGCYGGRITATSLLQTQKVSGSAPRTKSIVGHNAHCKRRYLQERRRNLAIASAARRRMNWRHNQDATHIGAPGLRPAHGLGRQHRDLQVLEGLVAAAAAAPGEDSPGTQGIRAW